MIKEAHRMAGLQPHYFAQLAGKIADMQASGLDVIRLDEGSPDLPPPDWVVDVLQRIARQDTAHSYQSHRGPQTLRDGWAKLYRQAYGVKVDPSSEVVLLQGSKEGIFHFTSVFIDPGDVVLVPDPGYITYTRSALYSGGEPVPLPLQANDGYLPDLYAIPQNVLRRTKLLWLNYPSNPTAATAPLEFLIQAVEFARKNQLLLCHDAAYTQVTFDGYRAHSIFEVPGAMDTAVEFNSLSKSHNLAGWRIGALVGNASVLNSYFNLKTNADSSHFLPIMEGAAAAMSGDQAWLVERNAVYQNRRDCVVLALRSMGLTVPFPRASLYVWCPIPEGWDSIRFVNEALENAKVSLTPGIIFGQQGEGFVRISLTAPLERLSEAMERLSRAFGKAG